MISSEKSYLNSVLKIIFYLIIVKDGETLCNCYYFGEWKILTKIIQTYFLFEKIFNEEFIFSLFYLSHR